MIGRFISNVLTRYVDGLIERRNAQAAGKHVQQISNCLVQALKRREREGGFIILMPSQRYGPILHAVWVKELPQLEGECFDPGPAAVLGWRAIFKKPAFAGAWRKQKLGHERRRHTGQRERRA